MTSATFGPGFLPELGEILVSTGQGISYGPDGEPTEVTDEPFLEQWRLRSLGYDPNRGRNRIITHDPDTVPDHVRIQSPADRPRRVEDSDDQAPSSSWWAMRGE